MVVPFSATNSHLGMLKAKLAKLKRELVDGSSGGGGGPGELHFVQCPFLLCVVCSHVFVLQERGLKCVLQEMLAWV